MGGLGKGHSRLYEFTIKLKIQNKNLKNQKNKAICPTEQRLDIKEEDCELLDPQGSLPPTRLSTRSAGGGSFVKPRPGAEPSLTHSPLPCHRGHSCHAGIGVRPSGPVAQHNIRRRFLTVSHASSGPPPTAM